MKLLPVPEINIKVVSSAKRQAAPVKPEPAYDEGFLIACS
jgi:hypothetical protein